MFQTKVTFADWQTPEQRKAHAEHWRREDARRRAINNALEFWRSCEKPLCRRNHTCACDMHACFERRWRLLPQDQKEYLRAAARATKEKQSHEAAHRAGREARDAYLERECKLAAVMEPAPAAAPERSTAASPEVRVRRL